MERGAIAGNGLSTSDKKSSSNSDAAARSMKAHSTEAFLSKSFVTGAVRKADNLDRPFDGGTGGGGSGSASGGGGGGGVGPTGSNSFGGANEALGNINRDDVYVSSSSCGNFAKSVTTTATTNLQPFDMFAPAATYKSPVAMAASVGFPFTSAQWRELERQAMIYKYMMCSVPVPPELLFPLAKNFPPPAAASVLDSSASSVYNVRFSRNGDPEPGRCKRTDGKKWRCSRDVAPHQKYCERHLHRGRPRSRKPVEVKSSSNNNGESHKRTRLEQGSHGRPSASASQQVATTENGNDPPPPLLLFNSKTDIGISAAAAAADAISYKGPSRDLGLMSGMVNLNADEQRWSPLLGPNMGFSTEGSSSLYSCSGPAFDQGFEDHHHSLNLFTYSNEIEPPTGFIDAWSIDNLNNGSHNNSEGNGKSMNQGPSLDLSMAMAVGSILDEGMGKVQLECYNEQSKNSNWLSSHVSWQPFAQGGPLAEALHPGSMNPPSPHDSISTPATTVSSPSGVLQRTFFSHSDSSVCNSPTFAAAHASEVAFPRFNQIE
ncbi:growth-regulating factor 2-like [Andrographis paniculata]|uniref:growth-regulating factor 2-like n=1 Tax=Andrographis paniculata TaxID=175694 RepID=UPI0021E7810B|nr:growth-regulating factor 2-like [Andrographis paniculata]XP_051142465.1 growth-regulating factor 2-like [Andrographis paniculata]XP_051142466.1 growth-regulating factor 2-like [Andrographis paniculata]